ncbi:cell filamentation protein Fic [Tsukamurella pseudospumae]|uniref:Cell filamentation protein Fic n=1 Tax=Tsukamurella pseudospumae TaxID=239498 RepID=A0A138AE67_9ACTN|nr:cell filamentation protein Fic [Tsukamurella pseudospumae]
MAYRTLRSVFHQRDISGADAEEASRRASPAALSWEFRIGEHSLFCLTTPRITALTERIMVLDARVAETWAELLPIARNHYFSSMIIEEIQATNEIENVHSTRREIADALESLTDEPAGDRRFREMVRLYAALGDRSVSAPGTLDDVRDLYDAVTRGEVDPGDAPDGARFRADIVRITSGQKVVHTGVVPEAAIDAGLTVMLAQRRDDEVPHLIRAAIAHLIFEVVHPFYDGNGRTGRFLLALDLAERLSPISWFALSATIFDNRDRYYQAFADAEHPLNRADATPFVETMLEIVAESLHRVTTDLADRRAALDALTDAVGAIAPARVPVDDDHRGILYALGQVALFGFTGAVTLDELTDAGPRSKRTVRTKTQFLVDAGLIEVVSLRPLRFRLSTAGRELCAIDGATV